MPEATGRSAIRLIRTLRQIEATVGALFAFLVGFVLVVLGGWIVCTTFTGRALARWSAVWTVAAIAEVAFLWLLKRSLEEAEYADGRPFAPHFAVQFYRRWPIILRLLAAAWFAAHFALGVAASMLFENLIVGPAATWDRPAPRFLAFFAVSFTVAYSANLYALLALAALGGGERLARVLWRVRILLDGVVAIAAAAYPMIAA